MSSANPASDPRSSRAWKVVAVLVVVVVLAAAQHFGIFRRFAEPAQLARTLLELGPWGYLAFIGAYALLQPFGVPGTAFIMAAPLIWPWPIAFALSMTGTMLASVVGFSFTRFVARDTAQRLIPARFQKYDDALATRAFNTVFFLRLVFWMPPLLHAFFGLSKLRFWTHFWASLLGYVPPLLLVSYFGQKLFDALREAPLHVWLAVVSGLLAVALATWLARRHALRRAARAQESATG